MHVVCCGLYVGTRLGVVSVAYEPVLLFVFVSVSMCGYRTGVPAECARACRGTSQFSVDFLFVNIRKWGSNSLSCFIIVEVGALHNRCL